LKLAIIIPAYNEAKTIEYVISNIPTTIPNIDEIIPIVIDDGSIDDTTDIVKNLNIENIISHDFNQGLGVSFSVGIRKAIELDVDYVVNLDADGQHSPFDILRFVDCLISNDADLVLGSRFLNSKSLKMPFIKRIGNRFFSSLLTFILNIKITDATSGYRAYSKRVLSILTVQSSFSYTLESLLSILHNTEFLYIEIPINVSSRDGKSRIVKNWFDYGIKGITIIGKTLYRHYFQ
jgi:glycosyltransferase involved in cell wall biosynthesis